MGSIRDERVGCRHREAAVEAIRDTKETIKCSMIKSEAATKRVGGYILLQRDFLLQITKYLSRTWSNGVHFSVSLCVFVFDGTAVDT